MHEKNTLRLIKQLAGGTTLLGSAITIVDERNRKKSIKIMISLMEVLESIYGLMVVRD